MLGYFGLDRSGEPTEWPTDRLTSPPQLRSLRGEQLAFRLTEQHVLLQMLKIAQGIQLSIRMFHCCCVFFLFFFTDMGRLYQRRPSWTITPINAKVSEHTLTSGVVICKVTLFPASSDSDMRVESGKHRLRIDWTWTSSRRSNHYTMGSSLFLEIPSSFSIVYPQLITAQRFIQWARTSVKSKQMTSMCVSRPLCCRTTSMCLHYTRVLLCGMGV